MTSNEIYYSYCYTDGYGKKHKISIEKDGFNYIIKNEKETSKSFSAIPDNSDNVKSITIDYEQLKWLKKALGIIID